MIRVENLCKKFKDNLVPIKDVSFEINKGDVIVFIGPSGTGKSTLLRMINLLEKPTSGKIFFNDIEITNPKVKAEDVRRKIGMVFQSFNLFENRTVIENVMCGPVDLLKRDKHETYELACSLLKEVDMLSHMMHYPSELSGGQKQRVAIARALAMNPSILLLDEPTSALDPTMVGEVENVISKLANDGMTMAIVTHDMKFAKTIATKIIFLHDGYIYEEGTPNEIFEHPKKELTIKFVNEK